MKFFWCQGIFFDNLISKMGVKMNFRIITKNHEDDSKIGFSPKIDFRADGSQESHPTTWVLTRLKTIKIVAKVYYSIFSHKWMVHTELVPYCQRYPGANTSIFEPVRRFQENSQHRILSQSRPHRLYNDDGRMMLCRSKDLQNHLNYKKYN